VQMHRLTRAVLKFIYFEYNKRHDSVNYVDYNHYTRRSPYPLFLSAKGAAAAAVLLPSLVSS